MRKFSKIFAVVLTLCVLFSAVATISFAEEGSAKKDLTYNADGVSNVSKIDFEEDANGSTTYSSSGKSGDSLYGWSPVRCGTIQTTTVIEQLGLDGVTTNKYLRMRRLADGGDLAQSAPYWEYYAGKYQTPTHLASDYSYVIADYDFGCDEYEYVIDGVTYHSFTVPEGVTEYELSYASTCNSYMILRGADDATKTTYLQTYIVKDKETGLYYMSANDKFEPELDGDFMLKNVAGAWDHITMVLEVDNNTPANSMLRYYFNGKLFASQVANKYGQSDLAIDSVRFNVSAGVVSSGEHYNLCIDNLAVNYYSIDYTSGDDVYGIDDYYNDPNHESMNLSICGDIVYNDNYTYFGTMNPFTASLVHADETVENFYSMEYALAAIRSGDYITLEKSLNNFVPDLQNIKELTFVTNGEATFSLNSNYLEYYKIQQTGNIYTIKYAGDDAMKLTWNDGEGEGRNAIKTQNLLPLFSPNESAEELLIYGKVDKSNPLAPTIEIFDHWEWDMDNDGFGDGKLLNSLTVLEINELREKGIDQIYAVPKFNVMPLAYEIMLEGSEEYFNPIKDYSLLTSLNGLGVITKLLEEGDVANITAYRSGSLDGATVSVPAGTTVNFELNGNNISESESQNFFYVGEGATLNLTSSKKGAYIYSEKTIINVADVDFANINLGSKETKKNFTLYGSSIVNFEANQNFSNGGSINVNICGGSYISTSNATMFALNEFDLNYDVFSASIYSANGAAFKSSSKNFSAQVTVESSTVLAAKFIDATRNYSATISNSIIEGFIPNTAVILGEYNIFSLADSVRADCSNLSLMSEVYAARSNNGVFVYEETVANPVGENFSVSIEIGLLTFLLDPANSSLLAKEFSDPVPVTWLNPDGDVHFVSYWLPGSVIESDISLNAFANKDFNNGWFKAKYTSWNNISADSSSLADRVVYKDCDNVLTPVYNEYFEALDINVSLQVTDSFSYNVYLPAIPEYEGFEFHLDGTNGTGFYINGKLVSNGISTNASINGVEGLLRLTKALPAESFESEKIVIKFIVNNTLITKEISVNVLDYAIAVSSEYEHGSKENMIVYAMMQYKINAYLEAKGIEDPESDALYNEISESYFNLHYQCSCNDIDYVEAEEVIDYTAIENDVIGFAYSAVVDANDASYASKFLFTIFVKNDSELKDFAAIIKDEILGDAELNFDVVECDDHVEYNAFVDAEYVNKIITISATLGEESVEATYSLAKYISENDLEIYKAIYVISEAAYQAKVSELEIEE